jgi:hypothetical protein
MKHNVDVAYVFHCRFEVDADDIQSARRMVLDHCGLTLGGGVHSSLPDYQVDWSCDSHPEKLINF